ncbi:dihydroneopterin aldolase [Pacificimonas flava]|uniref:Dihydroneopterin aldolase n=2 Tax=Pacificimonas TaxID=1960290 RepID=A0A219B7T2_9SPHN|nr:MULTISPECIES: dihydroneopterin aldolase [Pacificimonas]MBZ6379929.1 dihydroneopterin aldolase [Pacificimonas aurantium]OWV34452.1 dihydroneopterin aldolase [Pacificimonas flava]
MTSTLQLQVQDVELMVLTGIYSEETKLPQLLRVSVFADLDAPDRFTHDMKLSESKNYMDLKDAVLTVCPEGVHFTLVEAVADAIIDRLLEDDRVRKATVRIVKVAISENGESIGIERMRSR